MKVTKSQIEEMYNSLTQDEMKKQLGGISNTRLYRILNQCNITLKRKMKPRLKIEIVG